MQGLSCLILVFLALGAAVYPASGAPDAAGEISRAVESDGILHPALGFRVAFDEDDALLSTYRHPRATERDLKIDALLMARLVFKESKRVVKVRAYFFDLDPDKQGSFDLVTVSRSDLARFAAGALSVEAILNATRVEPGRLSDGTDGSFAGLAGLTYQQIVDYSQERNSRARIDRLSRMGVDVSPLTIRLMEIADAERSNDRVRLKALELQLALALDHLENSRRLSRSGSLDAR